MIRRALGADAGAVLGITRDTIAQVYPKYYPGGVVAFFLQHHSLAAVRADIENGRVWLLESGGRPAGTVTIQDHAVYRLRVFSPLVAQKKTLTFSMYGCTIGVWI